MCFCGHKLCNKMCHSTSLARREKGKFLPFNWKGKPEMTYRPSLFWWFPTSNSALSKDIISTTTRTQP